MPRTPRARTGLAAAIALTLCAGCVHTSGPGRGPRAPEGGAETAAQAPAPAYSPERGPRDEVQVGYATWYGGRLAGRRTASGERFDPRRMTAAHRTLPFGTWVEVTRLDTGQRVRVRITDRGPFGHEDRIIDLARGAAEKIDLVRQGVTKVKLRVVDGP